MNDDPLKTNVQFLRGVGPERARLLANLGIVTVEDLLWNLPRDVPGEGTWPRFCIELLLCSPGAP